MINYQAYKLNICSELEFPELKPSSHDSTLPDVSVRYGEVANDLDNPCKIHSVFQVSTRELLLKINGIARYHVTNGTQIVVDPEPEARSDDVRLFILGSAMGALLYQRGLLPLHGSAIETPLGAMVFVGPQGIGKSTLAAHYQRRGYRILNDDVCVIAPDRSGRLQVLPAFPKLRLCADALDRLGTSSAHLSLPRFDGDKYIVPIATDYCRHPVQLAAIHLLSASMDSRIVIKPFRGFNRIGQLLANLYRPEYLHGLASKGDVLSLAFRTAHEHTLVEVAHDRNPNRIEELIDTLEQEWQQNRIFFTEGKTDG